MRCAGVIAVRNYLRQRGIAWREIDARYHNRLFVRKGSDVSIAVQRLVAAVDLGSSKVTGLIGEVTGDARSWGLRVLGIGTEESTGIRRGCHPGLRGDRPRHHGGR